MDSAEQRRKSARQLLLYAVIGGIVFVVDVGVFRVLVLAHVYLPVAVTVSFCAGVVAHFTLNRFWNFRNFDRRMRSQLRTYLVIVAIQYLVQIATVELGVSVVHLSPLVAKLMSIVINFPIGFLGHRYFTFGQGITSFIRSLKGRSLS